MKKELLESEQSLRKLGFNITTIKNLNNHGIYNLKDFKKITYAYAVSNFSIKTMLRLRKVGILFQDSPSVSQKKLSEKLNLRMDMIYILNSHGIYCFDDFSNITYSYARYYFTRRVMERLRQARVVFKIDNSKSLSLYEKYRINKDKLLVLHTMNIFTILDLVKITKSEMVTLVGPNIVKRLENDMAVFKEDDFFERSLDEEDLSNYEIYKTTISRLKKLHRANIFKINDFENFTKKEALNLAGKRLIKHVKDKGIIFKSEVDKCLLSEFNRFRILKRKQDLLKTRGIISLNDFYKISEKGAIDYLGVNLVESLKLKGAKFAKEDDGSICNYKEFGLQKGTLQKLYKKRIYVREDFKLYTRKEVLEIIDNRVVRKLEDKGVIFKCDDTLGNYSVYGLNRCTQNKLSKIGIVNISDFMKISEQEASKYLGKNSIARLKLEGVKFLKNTELFIEEKVAI